MYELQHVVSTTRRQRTVFFGLLVGALFFIWFLGPTLMPLGIATVIAYLLVPLMQRLERYHTHPYIAATLLIVLVLGIMGVSIVLVGPFLMEELERLITYFPRLLDKALFHLEELAQQLGLEIKLDRYEILKLVEERGKTMAGDFLGPFSLFLKSAIDNVLELLIAAFNLLMAPVFLFFLLVNRRAFKRQFISIVPWEDRPKVRRYGRHIDRILGNYFRGQLMVCGIVAVLYSVGFSLVGLPSAVGVGVVAGLLNIIPYVGPAAGAFIAIVIALTSQASFNMFLGIAAVYSVVQMLEGVFITPNVVGEKVEIHPFLALLGLIVCGNLAGLAGMLIAIPMAAILRIVFIDLQTNYFRPPIQMTSEKPEKNSALRLTYPTDDSLR